MTVPHDRTADQFDAWLEAVSQRHSRPSSPNGATDPAAYDLVTTAHEFHASIRAAEQRAVPAIPAKAIWEDVMTSTTAGTISIPALTPSGADSPPNPPTRPTADSGWPKPGHWAVPAFLVAAAMIGILWFYSSFFGSSTTPEPTLQPGFAFSTPTDDINEWLVAPDDIDCGALGTPDPNSQGFNLGQNTSADINVDAYLPFGEAPALEQRQIAERYLRLFADCPRATTDPGVTDDVFVMPFEYASDDQIAAAQQISAALPNQDYREYFIYQPALDTAGDSQYRGRTVVLPGDVIQMADGRLGVPTRIHLVGQDSALEMTDGVEFAPSTFQVFERVDGHWLVDEMIQVCIGDCDAYWAELAGDTLLNATPAASPVASPDIATPTDDISEWLVDPSTYSCEDSFASTVTPESRPVDGWPTDRPMNADDYLPMTNAPVAEQRAIAERFQQMNTNCLPTSNEPVISDDFHWMPGPSVATATADQIETAQQISAALPMQDYRDYYIIQPPSLGTPAAVESSLNGTGVLLPRDVVQLADGRIGAPLRIVIEGDDPEEAIHALTGGRNLAPPVFMVFEWDGERWLYDELFLICIGECDEYWSVVAGDLPVDTLATPVASPAASPVATESTPDSALQPITPSECTVEGMSQDEVSEIIRSAPESPSRSWIPVGPIDPATSAQISQTDRAWQACDSFGSIGQRTVLQTDHLTRTGPEGDFDQARTDEDLRLWFERFDQRRDLGNAFLASMEETYLPTTQVVFEIYGTDSDTLPSGQRVSIPVPGAAILLADGRIALPISVPMTQAAWEQNQSPESDFPFIYMPVHILELDSETNSWLVDEVIEVCVGDCDAALDRVTEYLDYYGIAVPGTPAASPAASLDIATPSGIDDSLLDPGECTVDPLTNEEISALQQDPGSYPDRQYGPTSPVGDALASEIAYMDREFRDCAFEGNWRSMASQRLIHESRATGNYAQTSFALSAQAHGMTSEEYIAWHRDLSATLLPGDISDYVVLSDRDIATMTGRVVQPHHVVQLADGRIGAPESLVLPADNDIGGDIPLIILAFNIYMQDPASNDRWVLDESLMLCVGECDVFYEQMSRDIAAIPATTPSLAASPVAPAATPASDEFWLEPLAAGDCTVEPVPYVGTGEIISQQVPTRDHVYLPVTDVDPTTARQISSTAREWISCVRYTDDWNQRLQTENLNLEPGNALNNWDYVTLYDFPNHVDTYRELSDQVIDSNPETYWVEAPTDDFWRNNPQMPLTQTILPSQMVTLPDGRVGGPLSWLIPPDNEPIMADGPFQLIPFVILMPDPDNDDQWLVDEMIPLCSGDCTTFWQDPYAAFVAAGMLRASDATPSDESDLSHWLLDPAEAQCEQSQSDPFGTFSQDAPGTASDYLPFTPAPLQATRVQIASSYQLLQFDCAPGDAGIPAVSDNVSIFPPPGEEPVSQQRLDTAMALAETFNTGDPMDFVIEGDPLPAGASEGGPMASSRRVLLPDSVVQLPDGRYGAPLHLFMQTNHPGGVEQWIVNGRSSWIETSFVIYAMEDGTPHLDEIVSICVGDCGAYWASYEITEPLPATPAATPVATPADNRAIRIRHRLVT